MMSEIKDNTEQYIQKWAPRQVGTFESQGALLMLAMLREAQAAAHEARILNAQFGNIAPGYEEYAQERKDIT